MRTPSLLLLLPLLSMGGCLLVLPALAAAQEVDNINDGVDAFEGLPVEGEEAVPVSAGDVEVSIGRALDELDAAASSRGKETLKQGREKMTRAKKATEKVAGSNGDGGVRRGEVPFDSIVERLDKLERRVQADGEEIRYSLDSLEDDNTSMLEIVSQTVFDYITTRLTPKTDRQCSWSYSQCKCVPTCRCSYQFQLGDYTLSRSCRVNHNTTAVALCDADSHDEGNDDNVLVQAQRALLRGLGQLEEVLAYYAPATSPECDWRWSSLRCEPREDCRFYFKLGDYHVGRSCRLRVAVEAELAEKKREKEEREAAAKARKVLEEEEEEEEEDEDEEDEDEEDEEKEEEEEEEKEEADDEEEEEGEDGEREEGNKSSSAEEEMRDELDAEGGLEQGAEEVEE
ncbi:hypothetical protein VYU27_001484 [Nannochloropsis oceanica]